MPQGSLCPRRAEFMTSNAKPGHLLLTVLFLPTKGGTPVWFDAVYSRMGGREIHIVTSDHPEAPAMDAAHANTIHRLALRRHWWLRPHSLGMYIKMLLLSLWIAARQRLAAVHAGRILPEGLVGWVVARLFRLPLVCYAHGEEITTWDHGLKGKVMRFCYRRCDAVIANSSFTRGLLLGLGVRPERIHLISPGVDLDRFRPGLPSEDLRRTLGLSRSSRLVLGVGRLTRRKGFDNVLRAIPALLAHGLDVHYALVGAGEDREYLEGIAREAGVQDRAHFLGLVPADDLPRWYNAADVFIMANRKIAAESGRWVDVEGFGMVFLEAAACGKPAIAGRDGGTGSAILEGETGLLVDGSSIEEIVQALESILSDSATSERLARNALERARRDFSWETVTQRTSELVRRLNGGAGSTAAAPGAERG